MTRTMPKKKDEWAEARNPYIAIKVAAAKGRGLLLTPEEVRILAQDGAIETVAHDDLDQSEWGTPWEKIDPRRKRDPGNRQRANPSPGDET